MDVSDSLIDIKESLSKGKLFRKDAVLSECYSTKERSLQESVVVAQIQMRVGKRLNIPSLYKDGFRRFETCLKRVLESDRDPVAEALLSETARFAYTQHLDDVDFVKGFVELWGNVLCRINVVYVLERLAEHGNLLAKQFLATVESEKIWEGFA